MTSKNLEELKKSLYQGLLRKEPNDLSEEELNILYELSKDKDIQNILSKKVETEFRTQEVSIVNEVKIKRNAAECLRCKTYIESTHRHDFVTCACGAVSVDGGKDYLRRLGKTEDYKDCSEVEE